MDHEIRCIDRRYVDFSESRTYLGYIIATIGRWYLPMIVVGVGKSTRILIIIKILWKEHVHRSHDTNSVSMLYLYGFVCMYAGL